MKGELLLSTLTLSLVCNLASAGEFFSNHKAAPAQLTTTQNVLSTQLSNQKIKVLGIIQSQSKQQLDFRDYGVGMSYRLTPWLDSQFHWVDKQNHIKLKVDL